MTAPSTSSEAKARIRDDARRRRAALEPSFRAGASAAIARQAIALIEALGPNELAAYFAVRGEVDTRTITDWVCRAGVPLSLPVIESDATLSFRRYSPSDALAEGGFGIPAPGSDAEAVLPDVLIVPMVGFDRTGTRLGYGRGHYDRAIAHLRNHRVDPRLVGIAFAVQEEAAIPTEAHDIRMDFIVTENETIDLTVERARG